MEENRKLLVIVGATATGKTKLSIEIAKTFNASIVSADSMQVYKDMYIGSARPTEKEMESIPHYMVGCISPKEKYSVGKYRQEATEVIYQLFDNKIIPIVVGGTGLYINALTMPWGFRGEASNPEKEKELWEKYHKYGNWSLYEELKKIDPDAADKIHPNNVKRVIRALVIYNTTGKTKTQLDKEAQSEPLSYIPVMMGVSMPREKLYERIELRVDLMIEDGLVEEVKMLLEKGYSRNSTALQGLGYKEIITYLDGNCSLDEAIYTIKRDTRHFAKRQLTWFRRDKRIKWFEQGENIKEDMIEYIRKNI
jgi:tRNA dimethylallyltransferase